MSATVVSMKRAPGCVDREGAGERVEPIGQWIQIASKLSTNGGGGVKQKNDCVA